MHGETSPLGIRAAIPRCHGKQKGVLSPIRLGTHGHLRNPWWPVTRIRISELECCVLSQRVIEFALLEVEQEAAVVLHLYL